MKNGTMMFAKDLLILFLAFLAIICTFSLKSFLFSKTTKVRDDFSVSSLQDTITVPKVYPEYTSKLDLAFATILLLSYLILILKGSTYSYIILLFLGITLCNLLIYIIFGYITLKRFMADTKSIRFDAGAVTLASKNPIFAFCFFGADLSMISHVTMWMPYLKALNIPFFIIVHKKEHLKPLSIYKDIPVILLKDPRTEAHVIPHTVKAIFYSNNAQKNRKLVMHLPKQEHIQLLHGDSDKPPSYSPVSQIYSKLFVAGQMAIDRYAKNGVFIPKENFRVVGRPQVQLITDASKKDREDVLTVAYLPTWHGFYEDTQFSSLSIADKIISLLMNSKFPLRLLFKPHPMSFKDPKWPKYERRIYASLSKENNSQNVGTFCDDSTDPFYLYNDADILITDVSSVMIDFLYSGKPYLITNPMNLDAEELRSYPSLSGGYLIKPDGQNVVNLLALAAGEDPKKKERIATRKYAYGDLDYAPGELFQKVCLEILEGS